MHLVSLGDGTASLEFEPEEVVEVRRRLVNCYGDYTREAIIDGARLRVAGQELLYLDEWDAPCLIASTAAGVEMLAAIAGATATIAGAVPTKVAAAIR
ncbi:hypothetical protein IP88_10480 [alpha proteobacterium AAP81b]|nr:hypothetical protein IP88_10480 [alpha proteobacterium AAP81b]